MNRKDWIDFRAEEIYAKWIEAHPILTRNETALLEIATSEAEAEYEALRDEASIDRGHAIADQRERDDERRMDFV